MGCSHRAGRPGSVPSAAISVQLGKGTSKYCFCVLDHGGTVKTLHNTQHWNSGVTIQQLKISPQANQTDCTCVDVLCGAYMLSPYLHVVSLQLLPPTAQFSQHVYTSAKSISMLDTSPQQADARKSPAAAWTDPDSAVPLPIKLIKSEWRSGSVTHSHCLTFLCPLFFCPYNYLWLCTSDWTRIFLCVHHLLQCMFYILDSGLHCWLLRGCILFSFLLFTDSCPCCCEFHVQDKFPCKGNKVYLI